MRRVAVMCLLFAAAAAWPRAGRAGAAPAQPWLGVSIEIGVRGVLVSEVIPGTPAEYVGLEPGDEIESIDGRALQTPDELIALVSARAVGDKIALTIRRAERALALRATLSARMSDEEVRDARLQRLVDRPAPGFDLPVVTGHEKGALAELGGKIVVLEFMATWCEPCKSTYRALDALDGERDVVVLAVSSDPADALRDFASKEGLGFTILGDEGAIKRAYAAGATPTYVVIDGRGVVRHAGVGAGPGLEHAIFAARAAARDLARQ